MFYPVLPVFDRLKHCLTCFSLVWPSSEAFHHYESKLLYMGFTTFNSLSCLRSPIQFAMDIESDSMSPLLGGFGATKEQAWAIHTGRYLNLEFNHPL
jgi:hypothetical protein